MPQARKAAGPVEIGLVLAAHGRRYRVALDSGLQVDCMTRGKKSDVACGDRVRVARTGEGVGVIEAIEPRHALFYRSDAHRQKLIAANVTQVAIVVAAEPAWSDDLVNRCLAGAEHERIGAIVVFNKIDLPQAEGTSALLETYRRLGYAIVPLSAKRDIAPLARHLSKQLTVLVGQSGMGKSTIVNSLVPDAAARVNEISAALGTGRHTTTHAELYRLDAQSAIIDSPGLQEFGLHHLTPEDAAEAFVELRPFIGHCRFRNCRHLGEPGCAITAAHAQGAIDARRYASYRRLAEELARKRPEWDT